MPPADATPAAPGAICPPVPTLPGGQATVSGFADIDGIPRESVTRVNSSWSGGLSDEEVGFGFGKVCWEYRRAPGTAPVRFCFDLHSNSPA